MLHSVARLQIVQSVENEIAKLDSSDGGWFCVLEK